MPPLLLILLTLLTLSLALHPSTDPPRPPPVVRVGYLAPSPRLRSSDQGSVLRAHFFRLLNNTHTLTHTHTQSHTQSHMQSNMHMKEAGVRFQVKIYACDRNNVDLYDVVCDDIDILIHAQRACPQPLHKCRSVAHVMDTQDRLRPSLIDMKSMIGEIFLSTPAALKYCVTKFCLRNPSYFDLQSCKSVVVKARAEATQKGQIVLANKRQGPPIGQIGRQAPQPKERHTMPLLVGLVGNAHVYGNISEALQRANIPFIRERDGNALIKNTCIFYSKITVAIAWSPFVDDTSHTVKKGGDYWHEIKPAERFTNPFWFDIPAIGHSKFWSYQAYGPELLCATVECAVDLVKRISRGEMSTVVGRVQRRVLKDTAPAYSVQLMGKFLSDIHNMFQNSLLISEKNASDLLDTHSFKYSFRNDSRMFYE